MQKEYDVLRLIEHNCKCYVSSDNVSGYPLAQWIKYHPYLAKERMMQWIYDITMQLIRIHKCRGNPCYLYVNPYSIIVSEDEQLSFLDVSADSNIERVRMMQRSGIREYFQLQENRTEEADVYGLGKTIQYLLAFTDVNPRLTKKEEKNLQKIISRCICQSKRRAFHKVSEIQKHLPGLMPK